jgi:formylglycine-generating enzyme
VHGAGLCHGDITPRNILFRREGVAVLIDFGLAVWEHQGAADLQRQASGFSPQFASPEAHVGLRVPTRAGDLYSLAACFWYALKYDCPSQRLAPFFDPEGLPPAVAAVLEHALQVHPERRLAEAAAFAARLRAPVVVDQEWALPQQPSPFKISTDEPFRVLSSQTAQSTTGGPPVPVIPVPPPPLPGQRHLIHLPGGVEMALRFIPAGSFEMGSPSTETGRSSDEAQIDVVLSRAFWMAETPVTQAQWQAVMGDNPSDFKGAARPVENVSWDQACDYCQKVTAVLAASVSGVLGVRPTFRLPTEAEWEYACRANALIPMPYHFGSVLDGTQANCDGNHPYGTDKKGPFLRETTEVGRYPANGWGLRDMHGNVWEWCADAWDCSSGLPGGTDPLGKTGSARVLRGGSWFNAAQFCRAANRGTYAPVDRDSNVGFRPALVPGSQ